MPKDPKKPGKVRVVAFGDLVVETIMFSRRGDVTAIDQAPVMYQMSTSHPGLIERIFADGTKDVGVHKDGKFVPVDPSE